MSLTLEDSKHHRELQRQTGTKTGELSTAASVGEGRYSRDAPIKISVQGTEGLKPRRQFIFKA